MTAILFLRSSSQLGGIERQMLWHARRLHADGWRVTIACLYRGDGEHPLARAAREAGLSALSLPDPAPWSLAPLRALPRLTHEIRPDILHTADYRGDILTSRLRERPRWLAETQGHTNENRRMSLWNWLDVRALRRADAVAPVSAAWETWLAVHGVTPARMTVLANSRAILRPDAPPAPIQLSGPGPHLLYAGRLSPEKGVDILLNAWPALRGRWPQAQLWLLGAMSAAGGYRRSVERMSQQPGVHLVGFQSDIRPWLQAADAVIVPSRREAWGMTAFETLCAGTPLVASRVGGLPEVCRGAPHARLVTPGDAGALLQGLEKALSPDFPRGATIGQTYCSQPRFDPERRHQRLLEIYQRLLHQ